jgi:hypothetical protein
MRAVGTPLWGGAGEGWAKVQTAGPGRGARSVRRIGAAVLALVVLTTALVGGSAQPVAAAWPATAPGVPAGNVRIPFQVHVLERTEQTGVDDQGRPFGRCYDEIYVTFDKAYGRLGDTNDGADGRGYAFYQVDRFANGTTSTNVRYSTDNVFPVRWPQGTWATGPWWTVDHHDQIVYRPQDGFGGVSNAMFGLFVDTGGHPASESWCSPTKRGNRQQAMRASIEALELWTTRPVFPPVDVSVVAPSGPFEVGDEIPVTWTVENITDQPATNLSFDPTSGLSHSSQAIQIVSTSGPALPSTLDPGEKVTRQYVVRTLAQATSTLSSKVTATVDGATFSDTARASISVPPDVEVVLSTDVGSETKAGDEFQVTATITNHDEVDLLQIDSEFLSTAPVGPVKWRSGPLTAAGRDPGVDFVDLGPGETTTLHWTYLAEEAGVTELTAYIKGVDTTLWTRFRVSASTTVAIETTELVLDQVRLQPGRIVPGQFGNIRGTVTNTGSTDVIGVDFSLASNPELVVVDGVLADLDPSISPRIDLLEPDETREFMIPVAMVMDAGSLGSYRIDLRMAGTSIIDGESVEVAGTATAGDGLDLTPYWSTILGDVRANLLSDTIEFFEGINTWGESSTLGGVAVGSSEGALRAFQKMGDGILGVNDLLGEASGDGGQRLSDQGKAIVEAAREYLHTTSAKEMAVDLADLEERIAVGGVGVFADWLRDLDRAAAAGDSREVARLIAEPGTELAIGFGVEKAGGQILTKAVQSAAGRKVASYLKRAPKPVEEDWIWLPEPDYTPDKLVARELQDLKDLPTGVAITGETVARSGLTADEHGWMIDMAREHGVAFFVRPRPETAARFAKLGYNAKPMAIKLKSISEVDHKWLGWDDYADAEGLVVFREPKDPLEAMKAAVEAGELEYGGSEIDDIIARYNLRRAEWKSFEKPFGENGPTVDPRDGILHKLNGDTLGPGGEIVPGNGFTVQRYGKTVNTKVAIDPDGVIRFTHNNQPVYSDIDLMAIAKPDGSPIDPELHKLISEKAGFGIDGQHGDTALTSDFPNWEQAKKFGTQYTNEHKRGGDPLVIIQPDVTTLGYVDSVTVPDGPVPGSGYDLYGKLTVTYEGAGRL